jgi:hypothetical protein
MVKREIILPKRTAKLDLHGKEVFAVHRRTAKRKVHGKGKKAHVNENFARQ